MIKTISNINKIVRHLIEIMCLIIFAKTRSVSVRSVLLFVRIGSMGGSLLLLSSLSRNDARTNHRRKRFLELVVARVLFHNRASAFGRLQYLGVAQF